jgi:hypothetical protein
MTFPAAIIPKYTNAHKHHVDLYWLIILHSCRIANAKITDKITFTLPSELRPSFHRGPVASKSLSILWESHVPKCIHKRRKYRKHWQYFIYSFQWVTSFTATNFAKFTSRDSSPHVRLRRTSADLHKSSRLQSSPGSETRHNTIQLSFFVHDRP